MQEENRYISLKDCLKVLDKDKYSLPVILGKDSNNDIHIKDLKDLKNILISGSTQSGKSVFLKSFVNTILLTKTPKEVKFIMIDTKMVELDTYNGIEYLLTPVINNMEEAYQIFSWCLEEIERRVKSNTTNPSIVIIIDEFADVMLTDPYKATRLEKIVKEGSKVGIYTILSTSSPRKTVVTDTLQKYIKGRLAGALPSSEDSITVLGEKGAEDLMGYGDMIFKNMDTNEKIRVQVPFISTEETESIVSSIYKEKKPKVIEYKEVVEEKGPLYESAKKLVIEKKQASPTFLQKHLNIGYNYAARLIEQLEKDKVITPEGKNRKREILLDNYQPPIEEEVIKEENVKNEQQKPTGEILWLTKEEVKDALHMEEELPIKEIKLLPFLQEDLHHPDLSPFALIAGILKIYDMENSEMVETIYGVDISKQKKWYKKFLLTIGQEKPNEVFTEGLILTTLVRIANQYGNDFVISLYKNAMLLFPTSKIFCDYISTMMNYLYDNPKERNKKIYKEIQEIFKKIKKDEVEPRIWESMVLTNYCLTDLLGNDKSKAPYLSDIKEENKLKAINERSCFDILFGEEYI